MSALRTLALESARWLVFTGVLMVIAGLIAIAVPFATGVTAAIYVGVMLIFAGVLHFVMAFHLRPAGGMLYQVLIGLLYVCGGFWVIAYPVAGLLAITTLLGVYLLIASGIEFASFFGLRFLPGGGWILLSAIVNLILAVVIFTHLGASTVWLPGTLIGLAILFSGFSRLIVGFSAKQVTATATA